MGLFRIRKQRQVQEIANQAARPKQAVTDEHIICIAEMLDRPTLYRQRCVEHLSFLPAGGQQWQRTLQTQIPSTAAPDGTEWRIVSLGEFKRRRFPDFTITNEDGTRLNRLTRQQHGVVLTRAILSTHLFRLPEEYLSRLEGAGALKMYEKLRDSLYDFFTSVGDIPNPEEETINKIFLFSALLNSIGVPLATPEQHDEFRKRLSDFARDFANNLQVIQYLCWVKAEPNEILSLQVCYTNQDTLTSLMGKGRFANPIKSIYRGFFQKPCKGKRRRREARLSGYVQLGLAPLSYRFPVPTAHSYYLTIDPPLKTDVTYYDWGPGKDNNSFEASDGLLDSAYTGVHLHNRQATNRHVKPRTIRPYVRCRAREHKQIAFGALLNVAFVLLAAHGRFVASFGTSAQTWLLVTPTILIAFLAEQQKHYYAHTVRRQRAVLWVYLALSVIFLVAISFSRTHGTAGSQHWGLVATVAAWLFAASSIFICVWYAPLGYSYQLITEKWAKRNLKKNGKKHVRLKIGTWQLCSAKNNRPAWEVYDDVIRKFCDTVLGSAVAATLIATALIILTWQHPRPHDSPKRQTASQVTELGTLTTTTWPSKDCKSCNFSLGFVPTAPASGSK